MAIAELKLMEIEFPKDIADEILLQLIDAEDFHPEPASKFVDKVKGLSVLAPNTVYADLMTRVTEFAQTFNFKIEEREPLETIDVEEVDQFLSDIEDKVKEIDKVSADLNIMIKENNDAMDILKYMDDESFDFDELFASKNLQIRFGRMPTEKLDMLGHYANQIFLFEVFQREAKNTYCLYVTTRSKAPEIDNIFSSLLFERIYIPDFVHGNPREAMVQLKEQNAKAIDYLEHLKERQKSAIEDNKETIFKYYATLKSFNRTAKARQYVVVFGEDAAIYGFAEPQDAISYEKKFSHDERIRVSISSPFDDTRLYPPSKISNNWLVRPFKMFVEMYGVPTYTDLDPTLIVAVTYSFLFGIMFGDVGQGLLLSLLGYLIYKWKKIELGAVGVRIGLFAALFGILFGSVFGSEEILTPFFLPMSSSNTMTLLAAAIAIGVLLIIISISFNIYLSAKRHRIGELLFSQNGVSGLVFYVAVLIFAINKVLKLHLPLGMPFILICLVISVVLMFLKEPLTNILEGTKPFPAGFGGFFAESFFELFEVILTFISNTMSFLRVGGFVMSHAGMMLVVYRLAAMIGGFGYWIVLVIGNLFVMCLEGLVVGIQVLRLEFYEMFSRYYGGGGTPFVSMKERLNQ
ncbi:MAG: V-type ATP synthase subunit I [Erysipelotrichaceae bacterium]|nr:V-type ATP synthase subunit I [Erysipelotrichaceae bacterium]